jgi:hypothetical protein
MTKNINHALRLHQRYELCSRHRLPLEAIHAEPIIIYNPTACSKSTRSNPVSISILSDTATRMPTGIGVATGFAPLRSFLRALKHMLLPKSGADNEWPAGLPYTVYVDRGNILTNASLFLLVQHLHIQIRNDQPTQSILLRRVRKQLVKIGPTTIDIESMNHLLHKFVNEHYVQDYQKELGDTPMNLWKKELKAGWKPIILPENKVREAFSQLDDEDN